MVEWEHARKSANHWSRRELTSNGLHPCQYTVANRLIFPKARVGQITGQSTARRPASLIVPAVGIQQAVLHTAFASNGYATV